MLYAVLDPHFNVVKSHQNQNNEIGVPLTLLEATADTEIVLVEMGMRKPTDIKVLSQIVRPDIGILTGIGYSHYEFFRNQRQLAQSKANLFLPALNWQTETRTAFICHHSDYYELLRDKAKSVGFSVFGYGGATAFEDNLAICFSVGHHFGLSDAQIKAGLDDYKASEHRLDRIKLGSVSVVDDTYNANPHGVRHALSYLKTCRGRKLAVLGDMKELGKVSDREHQALLEPIMDAGVDILFTLGPAFKDCHFDPIDHTHFKSIDALKTILAQELKAGDVVLLKASRSHQLDQLIPFLKEHLQ